MGDGYLLNPVIFLVDVLFGLYILIVMLRFMLQLVRADFYNPFSQFVVKATNPPLKPLRRLIPGWGGIDVASLVLVFLLQLIAILFLGMLYGGFDAGISIPGLFVYTIAKLVSLVLYIYFFSLIVIAVLSWVSTGGYNPVVGLLVSITEPLLRPVRRLMPNTGVFDFSVMIVILGLVVARMLIMPPLHGLAVQLGFPLSLIRLLY